MCTRLAKSVTVRKRWFMIFDRERPFELVITLQKATPKATFGFGLSSNGSAMVVPSTEFQKMKLFRYRTKKDAEQVKQSIIDGTYCIRCKNHPRDCNKRIFKKWD